MVWSVEWIQYLEPQTPMRFLLEVLGLNLQLTYDLKYLYRIVMMKAAEDDVHFGLVQASAVYDEISGERAGLELTTMAAWDKMASSDQ
jgi:hypothetical protein